MSQQAPANTSYKLTLAGENALMLYFEQRIEASISAKVQHVSLAIKSALDDSLLDILPSYASILIIFNPFKTSFTCVEKQIHDIINTLENTAVTTGKVVDLPVYYSLESGPDLALIAKSKNISVDEVIKRHQAVTYRVYAIGFAPGFAYLGEVDPILEMPRLATPRAKVPKGAVAIADKQTAVYPNASPGGWNLIGLCPVQMFSPNTHPHMPVSVGDEVRFFGIDKAEFLRLGGVL